MSGRTRRANGLLTSSTTSLNYEENVALTVTEAQERTRARHTPGISEERARLILKARLLAWSSLAWMTIEGAVAIIAGLMAGSIALIGFGLDSAIEGIASVIVVWRFTGSRRLSSEAELRAQKLVAATFFLLAPYIAIEATSSLIAGERPEVSVVGMILTVISLLLMPAFGIAKRRVGGRLGSGATAGEGTQNLLCAYLSAAALAGLVLNALLGWWWADPAAALLIAALAVREGVAGWRGETCCDAC